MRNRTIGLVSLLTALVVLAGAAASGGTTTKVSVGPGGGESNGYSDWPAIDDGARIVAFYSHATNLVPGDTNGVVDIFVHDRSAGETRRVSVSSDGAQANGGSVWARLDAEGRLVAFGSSANNLVDGDTNQQADVFIHDLSSGQTQLVSVGSAGNQGNGWSQQPDLTPDGRIVAWASNSSNLVEGDANGFSDIFVRDLERGTTRRVSIGSGGRQANGDSYQPDLSADGRFVAFESHAANLVPADSNDTGDVFVHDLQTEATTRVSVSRAGAQGRGKSYWPSISADGRYVAFETDAAELVPPDLNGASDILVHDRGTGSTERVSVDNRGTPANFESRAPSITPDGRFVAFDSWAYNLVAGDTNRSLDVFVHDRARRLTTRVSLDDAGGATNGNSHAAAITFDGRHVAYSSVASNLPGGDSNGTFDVYVHGPVVFGDASPPPRPLKPCRVPRVVGLRLAPAKMRIRHANCALGRMKLVAVTRRNRVGVVLRQRPRPGVRMPQRGRVAVVIGRAARRH